MKVSETNYLQLLSESMTVLGAVSDFLSVNKSENRVELSNLSRAIKQIQATLRSQHIKLIRAKNTSYYAQKIQEEQARKAKLLNQLQQIREQAHGGEV